MYGILYLVLDFRFDAAEILDQLVLGGRNSNFQSIISD